MLQKCVQEKELREKLLYTGCMLVLFRLGCAIPVPFIDRTYLASLFGGEGVLGYLDVISGGALGNVSVFALGVSPAIQASISLYFLANMCSSLKRMQQENQGKYRKVVQCTAVGYGVLMGVVTYLWLRSYDAVRYTQGMAGMLAAIAIVLSLVAGAQIVVFLARKIDQNGIGGGMSLFLLAGILANASAAIENVRAFVLALISAQWGEVFSLGAMALVVCGVICATVVVSKAEARVPIQYTNPFAQADKNYLPIKLVMSGAIPIVWASILVTLLPTLAGWVPAEGSAVYPMLRALLSSSWFACVCQVALIYGIHALMVQGQFNAVEIANRLQMRGGVISGVRTGTPTAEYLEHTAMSVAHIGSFYLAVIAVGPVVVANLTQQSVSFSSTTLLVVCSCALQLVRNIHSYAAVCQRKGFLD